MVECTTGCADCAEYAAAVCEGKPCSALNLQQPELTRPFQVVDSVLVINPGTLSKRRAAGTYAQMGIHPRIVADEERELKQLNHKLYERARVDIVRI